MAFVRRRFSPAVFFNSLRLCTSHAFFAKQFPGYSGYNYTSPRHWTTNRAKGVVVIKSRSREWGGLAAPSGGFFVGIQGRGSHLEQTLILTTLTKYIVKFMAANRPGYGQNVSMAVKVYKHGSPAPGTSVWTEHFGNTFTQYAFSFTASAASMVVRFENNSPRGKGDHTVFIDAIRIEQGARNYVLMWFSATMYTVLVWLTAALLPCLLGTRVYHASILCTRA